MPQTSKELEIIVVSVEIVEDGKAIKVELENVPDKYRVLTFDAEKLTTMADLAPEL